MFQQTAVYTVGLILSTPDISKKALEKYQAQT